MPLGFQLRKLRTKAVLLRFVGWEVLLAALGVKFYDMPAELILDWCLGDIACRQNFEGIAKIGSTLLGDSQPIRPPAGPDFGSSDSDFANASNFSPLLRR